MQIHVIDKQKLITREDNMTQDWVSGYWGVTKEVAAKLVGGEIFLHMAKDKPSYFGGDITGFRVQEDGEYAGKVLFEFTASMDHKGVRTPRPGWGMDKKIIE